MSKSVSTAPAESSAITGIALMCLGAICMVGLDAAARWLLETYTLPQLVVLRCLFSIVLIVGYTAMRGELGDLRTHRPGWHVVRSFIMAGSMFAFFHALRHIPLADVIVIAFVAPLIVTCLSRPVLGEHVGPWRWVAVIVGFCGVLIILQPGSGVIEPAALIALGGSVMYASLSLTARKLSTTESTASLSLYIFAVPGLLGAAGSVGNWQAPDITGWLLFAICGFFGGLAFVFMNAAYRRAQASLIVPFEYTGLIWATAAGFIFWGEIPGTNTWWGAVLIVASGLFILFRETAVRGRPQPQLGFPMQEVTVILHKDDLPKLSDRRPS